MGPGEAIAKARFALGSYREAVQAARRLGCEADAAGGDPAALVEVAFSFRFGSVSATPVQIRAEIEELLRRMQALSVRRVLEIGTANGGTLFLLARASADGATLVSLDVTHFDRARLAFYRGFARRHQRVIPVRADSHGEVTAERVRRLLSGGPLDLLFIDGDHAYDGVRRDFELYAPLVRPGGLIALHDIVPGPAEHVGGVPQFWAELRGSMPESQEIVTDWGQGGFGIGLLGTP